MRNFVWQALTTNPFVQTFAGKDLTMYMATKIYDPKYGIPKTRHDLTDEHAATLEDMIVTHFDPKNMKCVGMLSD